MQFINFSDVSDDTALPRFCLSIILRSAFLETTDQTFQLDYQPIVISTDQSDHL